MRDVIIIGGGHNGLVAAAFLAKAGLRPLVLERAGSRWRLRDHVGNRARLPLSDARAPRWHRRSDHPGAGTAAPRPRGRDAGGACLRAGPRRACPDDLGRSLVRGAGDRGVFHQRCGTLPPISFERGCGVRCAARHERAATAFDASAFGWRFHRSVEDRAQVSSAPDRRCAPAAAMAADVSRRLRPRMVRE